MRNRAFVGKDIAAGVRVLCSNVQEHPEHVKKWDIVVHELGLDSMGQRGGIQYGLNGHRSGVLKRWGVGCGHVGIL